jgi:hypothetical protein
MRQASEAEPGKIIRALWLASEYQEEIEADFHRYYGLDYLDWFRPDRNPGWRKLLVLIDHLPAESAVNTAIRNSMPEWSRQASASDPAKSPWSTMETLLAVLIDETRMSNWMYASVHSDKTLPKPEPIRRPGASARRARMMSLENARAIDPRLRAMSDDEAIAAFRRLHGG